MRARTFGACALVCALALPTAAARAADEDEVGPASAFEGSFEDATIVGRVFCDSSGDGRVDEGEIGLPGAVVALDDGSFVSSDGDGMFHFSRVSAGAHLVKIDVDALPVGSSLVSDEARVVTLTRGLIASVNFAVDCALNPVTDLSVRPADPALAAAVAAHEAQNVTLTLDFAARSVSGGGPPIDAPSATLSVDGVSADVVNVEVADGRVAAPLVIEGSATRAAASWRFEVTHAESGAHVAAVEGEGLPSFTWDGRDEAGRQVLVGGEVYSARLVFRERGAWTAASAPVRIAAATPREQVVAEVVLPGADVAERGAPAATAALESLLASTPTDAVVVVDAHVDDRGDPALERAMTEEAAEAVAAEARAVLGLPPAQVRANARGATRPLFPNVSSRARRSNHRVEVRVLAGTHSVTPPQVGAPEPIEPGVFLGERWVPAEGGEVTDVSLRRPHDGLVTVTWVEADGARSAVLVALPNAAALELVDTALPPVPVRVSVGRAELDVGGVIGAIDGLSMRVGGDTQATLAGERIEPPLRMPFAGVPDGVQRWSFQVFDPAGAAVWETSGEGAPPGGQRWRGESDTRLVDGVYSARLTVRTAGGFATTPPHTFVVVGEGGVAQTLPAPAYAAPSVRVNGEVASAQGADVFVASPRSVSGGSVLIDVSVDGGRVVVRREVPEGFDARVVGAGPADPTPITFQATPSPAERPREPAETTGAPSEPEEPAVPAPAPASPPVEPAAPQQGPPSPFSPVSRAPTPGRWLLTRPAGALASPRSVSDDRWVGSREVAQASEAASPGARYDEVAAYYADALDAALSLDGASLAAELRASDAGQIEIQLPPVGVPLPSRDLAVFGRTTPTNTLRVNGDDVPVGRDGAFSTVVRLPAGASTLRVETRDVAGNVGHLDWPVTVSSSSLFLMALGDAGVGSAGAEIPGSTAYNTWDTEGGAQLFGQARMVLRGWISGEDILSGRWDDITLTAHVDTARREQRDAFLREVIDPERSYPVFGDDSEPWVASNARGPAYVLVEADDSSLRWGNFAAGIQGVQVVNYDRNLHGAQLRLDETAGVSRTRIRAHVADDREGFAHGTDVFRGTGGSIYYLSERAVLEGSERVAIVVRDAISGREVARFDQTRNDDYSVRYSEGRVIMKRPIPSVADQGLGVGNYATTRSTLAGNPVFIEVSYDHRGAMGDGELAGAVDASERLFDWVEVGGTVVEESRASEPDYRLWGVRGAVGPTESTQVAVEYGRSEGSDTRYAFSSDGGLRFDDVEEPDARPDDGDALAVRGRFELADVIDTERESIWSVSADYQDISRGYAARGATLERGAEKFGVATRLAPTEVSTLSFRLDRVTARVDDLDSDRVGDTARLRRQVAHAQYLYTFDPVQFELGYQRLFTDDVREADGYRADIGRIGIGAQITRWLRLGMAQEFVANGEDPRIIRGADTDGDSRIEDRFVTEFELGIRVADDLELVGVERFRYSGENSALVGVNAAVDPSSDVYVQQRFASRRGNHGGASTTVVGGEQRFGEDGSGRTYGEYHVDNGVSAPRERAVMGFGKRWELARGVYLDAGFERSETLATESVSSESARNTASFGFELLRFERVRASTLFEARFDEGSLHTPGGSTCIGGEVLDNPVYCRDRVTAVGDRRQLATLTSLEVAATDDVTLYGRFDYVVTENLTLDLIEARDAEASLAAAIRPVNHDRLLLMSRYTYLVESPPYELELAARRESRSHIVSVAPIIELPARLQWVEKLAVRALDVRQEGEAPTEQLLVMLINRLNFHVFRRWDAGLEYRVAHDDRASAWSHGLMTDVSYILAEHVRMGVGFNFSRLPHDEFGAFDRDNRGVFFRVSGQY